MKTYNSAANVRSSANGKLWFGFTASVVAWFAAGLADGLITWQACVGEEQWGGARSSPGLTALDIVLTVLLLGIAVAAGIISYRNWKRLSEQRRLINAEATNPEEYLALLGVFISATLSVGMVWLGIPLFVLRMCARIR